MKINYDNADSKMDELRDEGHTVYWRGYNICLFRATNLGQRRNQGIRYQYPDGTWAWGLETVFEPNAQGEWEIDIPAENNRTGRAYA